MEISNTFLQNAADIIGKTDTGLSGSKIAEYCSSYASNFSVDIPYPTSPFIDVPNKRTALLKNLKCFSPEQQFKTIKELCELPIFVSNKEVKELKIKLISKYGHLYGSSILENVNSELVEATNLWLINYPRSYALYSQAVTKLENKIFQRNLLDDLRLSLECLLQEILNNSKSIEKQLPILGAFFKAKEMSSELNNMTYNLIDCFTKYQNTYVKHDDAVNEKEIEFIFELTSSLMKLIIRIL